MYKQRQHVIFLFFLCFQNSIKLFLLFSTEMSRSRDVLIPFKTLLVEDQLSPNYTSHTDTAVHEIPISHFSWKVKINTQESDMLIGTSSRDSVISEFKSLRPLLWSVRHLPIVNLAPTCRG